MRLEIINSDAGFDALRDDWNRLAGDDPLNSWEWSRAWWHEFRRGGRLAIAVVRDGDLVLAIAPFYTVRRRVQGHVLQFLGSGKACTDYRRILLGPTDDPNWIKRVVDLLIDEAAWRKAGVGPIDLWELEGIDIEEPTMQLLVAGLNEKGYSISRDVLESTWVAALPRTWDAFVAATHRTIRRKIHKAKRRADDPEIAFHAASEPAAIAAIWGEFVRLHQCRFQDKVVGGGVFTDPTFERFLRHAVERLAAQGKVRLLWCTYQGVPISIQMHLLGSDTANMYQSGFDPAFAHLEPGHLLYSFTVEHLIDGGFTKLDFLRGDESYKADWNGKPTPLARVRCVSPRVAARLRNGLFFAARALKRMWRELRAKSSAASPNTNHRATNIAPEAASQDAGKPATETKELVEV